MLYIRLHDCQCLKMPHGHRKAITAGRRYTKCSAATLCQGTCCCWASLAHALAVQLSKWLFRVTTQPAEDWVPPSSLLIAPCLDMHHAESAPYCADPCKG